MELSEARGRLVIVGGGDECDGDCRILKEFIRLAKGPKANIVVMTVATDRPEKAGPSYRRLFQGLGVDEVHVVDVSSREHAQRKSALDAIRGATGLYFTGGDQLHITSLIGGTEMQRLINVRYEEGMVIGGTSAGAAMMSNSMILGGAGEESPKQGAIEIGPGMDLMVGAIIDTHFSQRGRFGRLLAAVAHYPQDLGVGIDESTALVVNKRQCEVVGEGAVTIIDAGAMSYTSLPYVERGRGLALHNVRVHVLPEGHRFDLAKREPIPRDDLEEKKGKSKNSGGGKKARK